MVGEKLINNPPECTCHQIETGKNSGGFVGSGSCQACWAKKREARDKAILRNFELTREDVLTIRNERGC